MKKVAETKESSLWKSSTNKAKETLGITPEDLTGKKFTIKSKIKSKTSGYFKNKIEKDGKDK